MKLVDESKSQIYSLFSKKNPEKINIQNNFVKLAIVGDLHFADNPPASRKDDYFRTIMNKLRFILNYCKTNNVAAVLQLGDIFHIKTPSRNSYAMLSEIIDNLNDYAVPFYSIVGNHDINMSPTCFRRQPMYVLQQAGAITILDNSKPLQILSDRLSVSINGIHFSSHRDHNDAAELYELKHNEGSDYKIGLYHQMILPDDKKFFDEYINFSNLSGINSDMVCCGHYHDGFQPSVISKKFGEKIKKFVNPGSIARCTADKASLSRSIYFTVVEISKDSNKLNVSCEDISVPAIKSSEVFDLKAVELKKSKLETKKFIDSLSDFEVDSLTIESPDGLLRILKTFGASPHLLEIASGYLDDVFDKLNK